MHSYSVDTKIRQHSYYAIAFIAFVLPSAVAWLGEHIQSPLVSVGPNISWPVSVATTYGVLFLLFDRWVWKWRWLRKVVAIPDLNGKWVVLGVSSYAFDAENRPIHEFEMVCIIRQTFTRLEVFTETQDSTSKSIMASFCMDHAIPTFSYAFQNSPKSKANPELQRHPGLIELRINSQNELQGDYFSGKHRLRFGELTLTRRV